MGKYWATEAEKRERRVESLNSWATNSSISNTNESMWKSGHFTVAYVIPTEAEKTEKDVKSLNSWTTSSNLGKTNGDRENRQRTEEVKV